jgi:hypothetical protein
MPQRSDADEQEYLESRRRDLRESVAFWAPENKRARELYTVRTLLQHLNIEHEEAELVSAPNEPPDITFRDARFEIKEALDQGRRRHDEYREKLEKAMLARSAKELMEEYTPQELTFEEIGSCVVQILKDLSKHYAPAVTKELDLLVYVNLIRRDVVLDGPIPDSSSFSGYGWRSVSVVKGSFACVFSARADAPEFLHAVIGRPLTRPILD